eukprot:2393808-Prymnesium_polylepis.2
MRVGALHIRHLHGVYALCSYLQGHGGLASRGPHAARAARRPPTAASCTQRRGRVPAGRAAPPARGHSWSSAGSALTGRRSGSALRPRSANGIVGSGSGPLQGGQRRVAPCRGSECGSAGPWRDAPFLTASTIAGTLGVPGMSRSTSSHARPRGSHACATCRGRAFSIQQ